MFFAMCSQKMYLHITTKSIMSGYVVIWTMHSEDNDYKSEKLANAQNIFHRCMPIRLKDAIVAKCLPFTLNTELQNYFIFSLFQT